MIPRRVTAPVKAVVTVADVKAQIREIHDFEDALIQSKIDAAVAHLDGWRGILGRCIMEQEWEVDLPCAGTFRLPLPDVFEVSAGDASVTLLQDASGSVATIDRAGTVRFKAKMPEEVLPVIRNVVIYLVAHWMENRLAVSESDLKVVPMAADSMLAPLRWVQF